MAGRGSRIRVPSYSPLFMEVAEHAHDIDMNTTNTDTNVKPQSNGMNEESTSTAGKV